MDLCGLDECWSGGASASKERACSTVRWVSTSVSSTPAGGAGGARGRGGLCATPRGAAPVPRDTPSSFSGMRTYCGAAAAPRAPTSASAAAPLPAGGRGFAPAPRDFFSLRPENRKFANLDRKPAIRPRGARAPVSAMSRAHCAAGARGTASLPSTTSSTNASAASSLPVDSLVVLALVSRQLTSATTGEKVTPREPAETERPGGPGGTGATSCSEARSSSGVSRCGVARARSSGVERTRASLYLMGVDVNCGSLIGSGDGDRGGDGEGDDGSMRLRSSSSTSSQAPQESRRRRAVSTDSSRS